MSATTPDERQFFRDGWAYVSAELDKRVSEEKARSN